MNPISAAYPSYFSVNPGNAGAAQDYLNSEFAKDFGIQTVPSYTLPMDYTLGYGSPYMGAAGIAGSGMMYPGAMGLGLGLYPGRGMSKAYLDYINMDYKQRLAYMHELEHAAMQNRFDTSRTSKQFAVLEDGQVGAIMDACRSLQAVVTEGETDQIVKQFETVVSMLKATPLYDELKAQGYHTERALDRALRNCAYEQFKAATGQDLDQMIHENCSGAFSNSFKNGMSFGGAQKFSREDLIARLHGYETPNDVPAAKALGKTASVATYLGAGAAIGAIGGPVGAVIGGIAGLGVGIWSALC